MIEAGVRRQSRGKTGMMCGAAKELETTMDI